MNPKLPLVCAALLSGCTGGVLISDPLTGLTAGPHAVSIRTCHGTWSTTSDPNGVFSFNPFDPNSSAIDTTKEVAIGSALIYVDGVPRFRTYIDYGSTCSIQYNGTYQDLPCEQAGYVLRTHQDGDPTTQFGLPLAYADPRSTTTIERQFIEFCIIENMR